MDEECTNCPGLCEARQNVVHGYGDVGGEFIFIAERPHEGADTTGTPFTGDDAGRRLQWILGELGFVRSEPDADSPEMQNAFCTYLTRCRHPDREPTDSEIDTCEPYLNAEIRMMNPQIIVPIGQRVIESLAIEYTTSRRRTSISKRFTRQRFVAAASSSSRCLNSTPRPTPTARRLSSI